MTEASRSSEQDRFLRWPFVAGAILAASVSFVLSWPVAEVAFSILFVVWGPVFAAWVIILLVYTFLVAVRAMLRRHWRSVLSTLALPAWLAVSLPIAHITERLVNRAHYLIYESDYLREIARLKTIEKGQTAVFDWGGGPMNGFNRFLIFDESDEIVLPPEQRSNAFRQKMSDHGFSGSERFRYIQRVAPHFNVVDCCW